MPESVKMTGAVQRVTLGGVTPILRVASLDASITEVSTKVDTLIADSAEVPTAVAALTAAKTSLDNVSAKIAAALPPGP